MFWQTNNQSDDRNRLLEYLDQHAFQPVRNIFPDHYRESMLIRVSNMQNAVMDLRDRYMKANSAQDVIDMYNADLQSASYQDLCSHLKAFNLPTFFDVQDGFERLAGKLELA